MSGPQPRTAIVRPPAFKAPRWAAASQPFAMPETTTAPAAASSYAMRSVWVRPAALAPRDRRLHRPGCPHRESPHVKHDRRVFYARERFGVPFASERYYIKRQSLTVLYYFIRLVKGFWKGRCGFFIEQAAKRKYARGKAVGVFGRAQLPYKRAGRRRRYARGRQPDVKNPFL